MYKGNRVRPRTIDVTIPARPSADPRLSQLLARPIAGFYLRILLHPHLQ